MQLQAMNEASIFDESAFIKSLDDKAAFLFESSLRSFLSFPQNEPLNQDSSISSPYFLISQEEILLAGVREHVSQIIFELLPHKPASGHLLNLDDALLPLVEVYLHEVPLSVASVQRLYDYGGTVSLEDSFQPVDVHL